MIGYRLYKHCIPVKGKSRSIIYDLWRNLFFYIPNSLCEILLKYKVLNIDQLIDLYGYEQANIIDEYWHFLVNNDLIHCKKGNFTSLTMEYETPNLLDNAIIDIEKNEHDYGKIKKEFELVGISAIELRFWHKFPYESFYNIMDIMSKGSHNDLHILVPYSFKLNCSDIRRLVLSSPLLSYIRIYKAKYNRVSIYNDVTVEYTISDFIDETCCGNISIKNFSVNIYSFLESLKYNNCLYKKVSIDKSGFIRNCPSMPKTYGRINNTSLLDVANSEEFTSLWGINKSMIDSCKECEYRYMCLDCRAYRLSDNIYSRPAKCKYNIDLCKWSR